MLKVNDYDKSLKILGLMQLEWVSCSTIWNGYGNNWELFSLFRCQVLNVVHFYLLRGVGESNICHLGFLEFRIWCFRLSDFDPIISSNFLFQLPTVVTLVCDKVWDILQLLHAVSLYKLIYVNRVVLFWSVFCPFVYFHQFWSHKINHFSIALNQNDLLK